MPQGEPVVRLERSKHSRWDLIVSLVGCENASVLDVGCRGRELRDHLPPDTKYVGMDVITSADVVASAEEPFPFGDGTFDTVVLADVLEHLNDPHAALDEAFRVARKSAVILLPNVSTLFIRLHYLLRGRMPGEKYVLRVDPTQDRHRWVLNFDQARAFVHGRAHHAGWRVARECAYIWPFRRRFARLAYWTARQVGSPNLWSWEYAARLEPDAAARRTTP